MNALLQHLLEIYLLIKLVGECLGIFCIVALVVWIFWYDAHEKKKALARQKESEEKK